MNIKISQRSDYTFKFNSEFGRHGWLRLTPAYSVKLVKEVISDVPNNSFILDPFSGTATTGLVAAEHGISAHCLDINEFLVWLGNAKCRNYSASELKKVRIDALASVKKCDKLLNEQNWLPNIHNIHRWWCEHTLHAIAALRQSIVNQCGEPQNDNVSSLAWIAFCRVIIETSSAAFNHISMSYHDKAPTFKVEEIKSLYLRIVDTLIESAKVYFSDNASVYIYDSRNTVSIDAVKYTHVITSPPYPNRISYIRELRPYMYWTKFLDTAQEASELDWKAIGGTWGIATSRLEYWKPEDIELPQLLKKTVCSISELKEKNSILMANYVWKYFHDIHIHFHNLRSSLKKGASLSYIVGNSSFYGVQVHTEKFLEDSLNILGFTNIESKIIRKRNSKKGLFEYCVNATWRKPSNKPYTLL